MSEISARASTPISFPVVGEIGGFEPIVVIGPNGVGKSRMMRQVAGSPNRFISAQRRTYLEEQIPTSRSDQSKAQMDSHLQQALSNPWQSKIPNLVNLRTWLRKSFSSYFQHACRETTHGSFKSRCNCNCIS